MNDKPLYQSKEADKWFEKYLQAIRERDTARAQADKAKRDSAAAFAWMTSNLPEMECRGDEDCDHCLGLQIINDWPVGAEAEYQGELAAARAQVDKMSKELEQMRRVAQTFAGGIVKAVDRLDDTVKLRAQVETLAGALREIAEDAGPSADRTIARAALKAAGLDQ